MYFIYLFIYLLCMYACVCKQRERRKTKKLIIICEIWAFTSVNMTILILQDVTSYLET